MKQQLLYVECKTNPEVTGPAWIGKGYFSRSGRTLYFNDMILQKAGGALGNYINLETHEEYWVSGPKRNERNQLGNRNGIVHIDQSVVAEYLQYLGKATLGGPYQLVDLNNTPAIDRATRLANAKLSL